MVSKRRYWILRLLIVVLLSILCTDDIRMSNKSAEPNEGRQLIDMSLEELMELQVAYSYNRGPQQLIDMPLEELMELTVAPVPSEGLRSITEGSGNLKVFT